jgi:hypothetical protein
MSSLIALHFLLTEVSALPEGARPTGAATSASTAPTAAGKPYPSDPFADEYLPLPPRGVGAAPGQIHVQVLGGAGYYRDAHLAGQGTFEVVALPNIGFRGSLETTVPLGLTDAQLFAARVGPALHLLPYRRVDLGLYLEAGGALVDVFRSRRTAMLTVVPGATFDIALGAYWAMHFEAQLQAGTADRGDRAELVLVPALLFGIGPVL